MQGYSKQLKPLKHLKSCVPLHLKLFTPQHKELAPLLSSICCPENEEYCVITTITVQYQTVPCKATFLKLAWLLLEEFMLQNVAGVGGSTVGSATSSEPVIAGVCCINCIIILTTQSTSYFTERLCSQQPPEKASWEFI